MPILLFDGHCNLCNAWVKFVVNRDHLGKVRFASLQSRVGKTLLDQYHIDQNYNESLVLIEEEGVYFSSSAALRTLSHLSTWESHLKFLLVLPRSFRNLIYSFVAKYRYKWFGRQEQCMVPTAELSQRFLED